ncbi:OmpA family protein [Pseudomonas syringae]|nr:OmpA family protein [Pseudomonas syringae]MBD8793024.1 OmpA family protein [Pseudomonas syringae]MBD8803633.1 OmpA family protein [Pseudomonas syringae]MBD8811946.1 OmpA family protein [Pseudomonas syringae]
MLESLALFETRSAELSAESTKALIQALARIRARPDWLVVVTGHADARGEAAHNLHLSQQRARVVGDWLQRMGDIASRCLVL